MSSAADLNARIVEQGNRVRKLKQDKAPQEDVQNEVLSLKALKAELAKLTGVEDKKGGAGAAKKAAKFTLKTAKVRAFCTCTGLDRRMHERIELTRSSKPSAGHQRLAPDRHVPPPGHLPQDHRRV